MALPVATGSQKNTFSRRIDDVLVTARRIRSLVLSLASGPATFPLFTLGRCELSNNSCDFLFRPSPIAKRPRETPSTYVPVKNTPCQAPRISCRAYPAESAMPCWSLLPNLTFHQKASRFQALKSSKDCPHDPAIF